MASEIIELSKEDQDWLAVNYPGIKLKDVDAIPRLSGSIEFDMVYDPQTSQSILNSGTLDGTNKYHITDTYKVEVILNAAKNSILPVTQEVGGRIESLAKKLNKPIIDLHTYPDGSLCLCARQAELSYFPEKFELPVFIQELLIPFLYSHTFYERNGVRPWGEHQHGALGILEYYTDQQKFGDRELVRRTLKALKEDTNQYRIAYVTYLNSFEIRGHWSCVCGLKKRIDKCHPSALLALRKLRNDAKAVGLNINDDIL